MLILIILNMGIALLLITASPKNRSSRYLSLLFFLCGIDVFLKISRDYFIYNNSFNIVIGSIGLRDKIMVLFYIMNSFTYFFVPLFYFIFAFKYANLSDWWLSKVKYIIFSAVVITLTAIVFFMEIWFPISYYAYHLRSGRYLLPFYLYNTLLVLIADYLIARSYLKEIKPRLRRERLIMSLILAPSVTFFIATRYILTLLRLQDTYTSLGIIQIMFCLLFLYSFSKYGLMGLKLNIEHYNMERYSKSITSGAAIINHSLKNELIKISLCLQSIKHYGQSNPDIQKNVDIINNSIDHLKPLINHFNEETKKFKLELSPNNIHLLVEETIAAVKPFVQNKEIAITNMCRQDLVILSDRMHICKSLENIILNSIDSITTSGAIRVSTEEHRRYVSVIVEDDGNGISEENLKHVLEPHFTTKKSRENFGLGLFYCYNIIEEHDGFLQIQSQEEKGTLVSLNFPNSKLYAKSNGKKAG